MKTKLPPFLDLYRALIATPSINTTDAAVDQSNKALVELLADWCQSLGFKVNIEAVPNTRNKFNLLASLGEGSGGLLLSGHTDTVPFDDGRWTFDPFTLTEQDNKLYGLGTADMKGFFAFILSAVHQMDTGKLTKPLHILATADEETSMAGARHFSATTQLRPDCAIIGEPTSLKPVYAHKGHLANAIRIIGQSGHSSDPARGVNAIELMHEVINQLLQLRQQLMERYHNPAFAVPYPTMNLGHIHGGDSANRICACCELHMDIRPMPGLTLQDLDELLHTVLAPVAARWPNRLTIEAMHEPIPGYQCPKDHPFVHSIETMLGESAESVNYCTEAPYIQELCPTLVLGPGSIEQAHQPDEFLHTSFIKPTHQLIQQMVKQFCY